MTARRERTTSGAPAAGHGDVRPRRARHTFDVCVVGHVTRDLIRNDADGSTQPGGTAYYAALALRALGARVAVVTRCARGDAGELLHDLHDSGVSVHWRASTDSTLFENIYDTAVPDSRTQRILATAESFSEKDIPDISALAVHLGPLTPADISASFAASLLARSGGGQRPRSSLDLQGLVRGSRSRRPADAEALVGLADIVKADTAEAAALTGSRTPDSSAAELLGMGPSEVLLTRASRGSLLYTALGCTVIAPAPAPGAIVDRTGCGDTYAAAYLFSRVQGCDPVTAARFASAAAAAKLGWRGALRGLPGGAGSGYATTDVP